MAQKNLFDYEREKRDTEIFIEWWYRGRTLKSIADQYKLSPSRVREITLKEERYLRNRIGINLYDHDVNWVRSEHWVRPEYWKYRDE